MKPVKFLHLRIALLQHLKVPSESEYQAEHNDM